MKPKVRQVYSEITEREGEVMELKPCPFCGSKAEYYEGSFYHTFQCSDSKKCDVISHTKGFQTKKEAIKAWNTRKP